MCPPNLWVIQKISGVKVSELIQQGNAIVKQNQEHQEKVNWLLHNNPMDQQHQEGPALLTMHS